jgi:outer membrane protein assembly factor BamA
MGDHNFLLGIASYYGYQNYMLNYTNMKRRLQYYANLFSYKMDYYYYTNFGIQRYLWKRFGAGLGIYYPLSRSSRVTLGAGVYRQDTNAPKDIPYSQYFQGWATPINASFTVETTRFSYYGPNMGYTFNLSLEKTIKAGSSFRDSATIDADFRKYFRLDSKTVLAFRLRGFLSEGDNPTLFWIGGNNTIRAAGYYSLVGDRGFLFNAEFRFSILNSALTPLGNIGPLRGTFFFDVGSAWFKDQTFRFFEEGEGFKLQDPISSYGFGIQTFLFGIPFHFDWVYTTNFKSVRYVGFKFWIGFDF